MDQFTQLERDILDWIAQRTEDPALAKQCRSAIPVSREYTGCGFFVGLAIPDSIPTTSIDLHRVDVAPVIDSSELTDGGGVVLFCDKGKLSCLEIYANGNSFPEFLGGYSLSSWEDRAERT